MVNTAIRALLFVLTACAVTEAVLLAEDTPRLSVIATLFQISGLEAVDNIKLYWNIIENATFYRVLRSTSADSSFTKIATVSGNIFDDYGLEVGKKTYYQVKAYSTTKMLLAQAKTDATPYIQPGTYLTYDNTVTSILSIRSNLQSGGIFYRYNYHSDANGFLDIKQQTSTNGLTFAGSASVLNRTSVCASIRGKHCRLEGVTIVQNPATSNFVLWAHLENSMNYTTAQVAVAEAVPGRPFHFIGTYRPLGYQSRDLTIFGDTDGSGYLISTTNGNSDMNMYKLNQNWTRIDSLLSTILVNQWREAPAMVHVSDWYYLFTSDTAGWYPSQGLYISSKSVAGPWSELREPGNTATFGAQSGGIFQSGKNYAMMANQWISGSQLMLPLTFKNGYATYGFYRAVKYNPINGDIVPVQSGRIISINKPSYSDRTKMYKNNGPNKANDGEMSSVDNGFVPSSVPFKWEVDLLIASKISQIDITFQMIKGSETASAYQIRASLDGINYDTIVNKTENTSVGFISSSISSAQPYRYVQIAVSKVTNVHNNQQPPFGRGLIEVLIYSKWDTVVGIRG